MSKKTVPRLDFQPLMWGFMHDRIAQVTGSPEAAQDSLREFLHPVDGDASMEAVQARYGEIDDESPALFAALGFDEQMRKLFAPLRQAKASYVLQNYLGTIALCGMVAEMTAILTFEIWNTVVTQSPLTEDDQSARWRVPFERLMQGRRIDALKELQAIDPDTKGLFTEISRIRQRYLHYYSQDHSDIAKDARAVFTRAVKLTQRITGAGVSKGAVRVSPMWLAYIRRTSGQQRVESGERVSHWGASTFERKHGT